MYVFKVLYSFRFNSFIFKLEFIYRNFGKLCIKMLIIDLCIKIKFGNVVVSYVFIIKRLI